MVHSTAKAKARAGGGGGGRGGGKAGGKSKKPAGGARPPKRLPEVVFDDAARRDYLTGFSKRKQAKKDAGRLRAEAKEREERLQLRQQLRDSRREQAATNVRMAQEFYGGDEAQGLAAAGSDDEDMGVAEPQEEEYSNDEMTTRVVVEEFRLSDDEAGPSTGRTLAAQRASDNDDDEDEDDAIDLDGPNSNMFAIIAPSRVKKQQDREKRKQSAGSSLSAAARASGKGKGTSRSKLPSASSIPLPGEPSPSERDGDAAGAAGPASFMGASFVTPNDSPEKRPAKRFTYETKAARKVEAAKQKVRRIEKAEAARSKSGGFAGKTGRGAKATGKKRTGKR